MVRIDAYRLKFVVDDHLVLGVCAQSPWWRPPRSDVSGFCQRRRILIRMLPEPGSNCQPAGIVGRRQGKVHIRNKATTQIISGAHLTGPLLPSAPWTTCGSDRGWLLHLTTCHATTEPMLNSQARRTYHDLFVQTGSRALLGMTTGWPWWSVATRTSAPK
jgi:hypothetical protein